MRKGQENGTKMCHIYRNGSYFKNMVESEKNVSRSKNWPAHVTFRNMGYSQKNVLQLKNSSQLENFATIKKMGQGEKTCQGQKTIDYS